jgi:hypothetical protein
MANKVTSPVGGKRGCLCKDNTYKKECCTGEIQNQGVGALVEQYTSVIVNTNTERVITKIN